MPMVGLWINKLNLNINNNKNNMDVILITWIRLIIQYSGSVVNLYSPPLTILIYGGLHYWSEREVHTLLCFQNTDNHTITSKLSQNYIITI